MIDASPLIGKVAVVTGAARGLGRAYALRLASLGADIVIVDIDLKGAAQFGEVLGGESVEAEVVALGRRALAIEADLACPASVNCVRDNTLERFGRVDVLVNNAGGAIGNPAEGEPSKTSPSDLDLLLNANFKSMVLCCQAFLPTMRRQSAGSIINTASQASIACLPAGNLGVYGAAKAAVLQYSRALAAEVGPDGIRVNCISPGIIMTARIAAQAEARGVGTSAQAMAIPLRRLGTVEDCAKVVEFLATDLSGYITGQCISVCGGAVLTAN